MYYATNAQQNGYFSTAKPAANASCASWGWGVVSSADAAVYDGGGWSHQRFYCTQQDKLVDIVGAPNPNYNSSASAPTSSPATQQDIQDAIQKYLKENPTSLLIKTRPETLESVAEVLNRSYPDVATKTWGGPHNMLELTPKGVHKATGLALIADDLGFKPKNIMAFGDEYNDVEMLEFAGRGVVMKNGSEQAKKVANDMTEYTNDEDGLARYLEKYLSL